MGPSNRRPGGSPSRPGECHRRDRLVQDGEAAGADERRQRAARIVGFQPREATSVHVGGDVPNGDADRGGPAAPRRYAPCPRVARRGNGPSIGAARRGEKSEPASAATEQRRETGRRARLIASPSWESTATYHSRRRYRGLPRRARARTPRPARPGDVRVEERDGPVRDPSVPGHGERLVTPRESSPRPPSTRSRTIASRPRVSSRNGLHQ